MWYIIIIKKRPLGKQIDWMKKQVLVVIDFVLLIDNSEEVIQKKCTILSIKFNFKRAKNR